MKATMAVICLVTVVMVVPCFGEPLILGPNHVNLCGIHVYDSKGYYYGVLAGNTPRQHYAINAYNPQINRFVSLRVQDGNIPFVSTYFMSGACTGQPLILPDNAYQVFRGRKRTTDEYGRTVYVTAFFVADIDSYPEQLAPRSFLMNGGSTCYMSSGGASFYKAIEVSSDEIPFPTIAAIPLRFEPGMRSVRVD